MNYESRIVEITDGVNFWSLWWRKVVNVSFEYPRISFPCRGNSLKRLTILVVAILALPHQVSSQVPKRQDVVGPVKSFREETARLTDVNGDIVEGPRVLIQTVIFDNHGKAIEQVMNNPDGTRKWRYKWNARSTYDSQGRETERVSYNDSGEATSRTVWVYEDNGNLTKAITYWPGGEIRFYDTFEYDENGHKIRANFLNGDGSTRGIDVFVYDSRGHLTQITHSEAILQYRDSYKYDDRGNKTEWSVHDRNGNRELKISWGYGDDSRGIATEFVQYDGGDKVICKEVYTYEFDSRGNWIKSKTRRELFGGQVIETEMTYRTITYRQPR